MLRILAVLCLIAVLGCQRPVDASSAVEAPATRTELDVGALFPPSGFQDLQREYARREDDGNLAARYTNAAGDFFATATVAEWPAETTDGFSELLLSGLQAEGYQHIERLVDEPLGVTTHELASEDDATGVVVGYWLRSPGAEHDRDLVVLHLTYPKPAPDIGDLFSAFLIELHVAKAN